jgi:phage terminase large subunit
MNSSRSAAVDDSFIVLLAEWKASPAQFVRDALGANPEPWQQQALDAVAKHHRVAIRSGHGIGKSALLAWLVLWFGFTRSNGKIPSTAPTSHQLEDVLLAEVRKWLDRMRARGWGYLTRQVTLTQEAIRFPSGTFAALRTGSKDRPEALQGFHAADLLFLLDEASGIEDVVFEVAGGALSTANAMVVMTGNPTRTSGYFYQAFHSQRAHWHCLHVPCTASSQVSAAYVEQMLEQYGEDSNVYRVRVQGEFPLEEDAVLVPLHLCEAAINRDVAKQHLMPVWGLDVARFGSDDSALCKRQGNRIMEPLTIWRHRDLMQIAGLLLREYNDTDDEDKPSEILIDAIGLGAGVLDRCRELSLPVRGINVGEAPATDSGQFSRLRDELWWRTRERFAGRDVSIPEDARLIGELTSVQYAYTSNGKLQVEGKDSMRKRGLKSPDAADALVLTFAGGLDRPAAEKRYERYSKRGSGGSWMSL